MIPASGRPHPSDDKITLMVSSMVPPYLLEYQLNSMTKAVCMFSPGYYFTPISIIIDTYMYKDMPHHEWNRIIGFNKYFSLHIPGHDLDKDKVDTDANLDKKKYVYGVCLQNTR